MREITTAKMAVFIRNLYSRHRVANGMIQELVLDQYRGFQTYRVSNLARVNLFVGQNNAGKTSVLEAVHLLVSGGDPLVLIDTAKRRGEVATSTPPNDRGLFELRPEVTHFFYGHKVCLGANFSVQGGSAVPAVHAEVVDSTNDDFQLQQQLFRSDDLGGDYVLQITSGLKSVAALGISTDGLVNSDPRRRVRRHEPGIESTSAVRFLTSDSLDTSSMSEAWDHILEQRKEGGVIGAMSILKPDIEDIHFQSGNGPVRNIRRSGIVVGLRGQTRRVPLGSQGDGMRRLLALSLSLAETAGGTLMVDEIDTGLHWSVMGDVWRLIVESAVNAQTQVFATTHSLDCLKGLSWLCENYPQFSEHVAIHKIHPALNEAVTFDGAQLQIAIQQMIEVR